MDSSLQPLPAMPISVVPGERTAMRFGKVDSHLQLALEMRAFRVGISLQDIENKFKVGRRTAMRMRDAILRNFPQTEELIGDDRIKRWRIPGGVVERLVSFSPEELADIKTAATYLRKNNLRVQARSLDKVLGKLNTLMEPKAARKAEPDVEALLEAEGIAMRPGPRPMTDTNVVNQLREAVKACRQVVIHYRNRRTRRTNERLVHPYGFLLGHRNYLVGFHDHPKANKVALFILPNIEKVDIKAASFTREPNFSLQAFAEQSFGIYQEEPFDVVWRFVPEAAEDAKDFLFHPTQILEPQKDGSLMVKFRAGGELEMAWHLYTWGDQVEVIEPKSLADICNRAKTAWQGRP
jgi:predicted DNA-binding transcriptional regulator YafY